MNDNPYVGPGPYERTGTKRRNFYGREREARELRSLIVSERVVLFYAQSGAGKTSLLNAQVIPELEAKGFNVPSVVRVGSSIPPEVDLRAVDNVFVFSALMDLAGDNVPLENLLNHTLLSVLQGFHPEEKDSLKVKPLLLIFDQFEELFTTHRDRWRDVRGFFVQVRRALDALPRLRVVFAMREDYVVWLDPYVSLFPRRLRARFRMERLRRRAALSAVTGPLADTKRSFAEGVAEQLVQELQEIQVETADKTVVVAGEFVEPVQLQVVCQSLWRDLPSEVAVITQDHLRTFGNVDQALSGFYERAIKRATRATGLRERTLRTWFEHSLITTAGTRGTAYRGREETGGIPNEAVQVLEDLHLIRGEWRAGARWYELTHDRFVEPIQGSNQVWRENRRRVLFVTLGAAAAVLAVVLMLVTVLATGQRVDQTVTTLEAVAGTATTAEQQLAIIEQQDSAVPFLKVVMRGHTDGVKSVSFSPDGKFVVTASSDHTARVWEASTGESVTELHGHTEVVNSAAFSRDGGFVVTASSDYTARVWEVSTGQTLIVLQGHGGPVWMASFSPDLRFVVTASLDGTARVWDASTGEVVAKLEGHRDYVYSVAFSPDGKWVVTASEDSTARVWDAATGQELAELRGHTGAVVSATFSPDGKFVVTASVDNTARVWEASTGESVTELHGHTEVVNSAAFSRDGGFVVTASSDYTARVWEVSTGQTLIVLQGHGGPVWMASFSPDLRFVVTASEDNTARVWETMTGNSAAELRGHTAGVNSASFSPDGQFVVTASGDNTARMWEAGTAGVSPVCVPAPIAPKNGAVLDNGRLDRQDAIVWDFSWTGCEEAILYHLYVKGSEATIPVIDDTTISQLSYRNVSEGSYIIDRNRLDWVWKVRAKIEDQWGEWSETWMFDVEPVDSDPPLVTHSTGPLEIPQTWTADLDEGVVGAGPDADIWFEAVTATERYVVPQNGASIAVVGTSSVGRDGCATAPLSTARIPVNGLPEGTYVCVQTNSGRYSQFHVNAPIGPSPGTLIIGYTTWER